MLSLVSALRQAGPGSYLIAARTQVAALQETSSYPLDWGPKFNKSMSSALGVRVAYATDSAVLYTLHWPAGAREQPLDIIAGHPARPRYTWTEAGIIVLWLLLALLAIREFTRLWRPSARLIRLVTYASVPLLGLLAADIVLRFVVLS